MSQTLDVDAVAALRYLLLGTGDLLTDDDDDAISGVGGDICGVDGIPGVGGGTCGADGIPGVRGGTHDVEGVDTCGGGIPGVGASRHDVEGALTRDGISGVRGGMVA